VAGEVAVAFFYSMALAYANTLTIPNIAAKLGRNKDAS
jgi:hypothetical protein